jgi:hypothetical protein
MKNVFPLLILVCFSTIQAWSQKNGSVQVSLGGALPVGKFASKDAGDVASGLARLGGLAEIGYSRPVGGGHWGVTAGIRGRLNEQPFVIYRITPLQASWIQRIQAQVQRI